MTCLFRMTTSFSISDQHR